MATDRERENQEQINRLLAEANRFAEQEARYSSGRVDFARQLNAELRDQIGARQRLSDQDTTLRDIGKEVLRNAQQNFTELGNINKLERELLKAKETQLDITRELTSLSADLTSEQLANAEQISNLLMLQAAEEEKILELNEQQRLHREGIVNLSEDELRSLNNSIAAQTAKVNLIGDEIQQLSGVTAALDSNTQAALGRVTALRSMQQLHNQNVATMNQELQTQRNINDKMGVTGSIVEGIGGIMQRIGLRSGIFNDAMEKAKQAMHDLAEEAERTGKNISKAQIAGEGLRIIMEGVRKAMFDPLTLTLALLDGFFDLNKAGVQFGQMTGQAADAMHGVNTEVATAVDMLNTASSITREIGLNAAAIFSPKQIGQISDAVTLLGLGEAAAGRLGILMNITGKSADQLGEAVYKTVGNLNAAGKSAVAPRQVLEDVLTASEDITISLGNNPKKLAEAATAARKFGMTLSQVDKIADSLLDFESSIEAELEAQLLTGKNINMAKARELALSNDLAGLAKELEKQGVSAAEFSKMNRIQQEATAKALGMSRQELAKSLLTQEAQKNMTEEQIAAARGVSLEESKRISIQERIQKAVQKLQQAFAPVLEALVPIAESFISMLNPILAVAGGLGKVLASVIKIKPVMFALKAAALGFAAIKFTNMTASFLTQGKTISFLVKKQAMLNAGMVTTKNLTLGQTVAVKLHTAAQTAQNFVVGLGIKIVKGIGNAFLFAARGIGMASKAIGLNTLLQGAWNKITAFGNWLMKSSAVQWALSKIRIVADTGAKWLNFSATTAVNSANSAAGPAAASAASGFAAAGAGLGAFGVAAAPAIPIILGIGAALLMASPAIYALGQMITGLATVIGNVLMKALEMLPSIIDAVAQGFVTMLGAVTLEKIAALALMGPALMSVAAGLGVLGASMFLAIPAIGMLGAIALMGPGLAMAGDGITKMAEGVARLSSAIQSLETEKLNEVKDLITTTAFAAPMVAASGAITSLIQGITGGGEKESTDAKLDELIAAVREGHIVDIYLDGEKISRQQALTATTLS